MLIKMSCIAIDVGNSRVDPKELNELIFSLSLKKMTHVYIYDEYCNKQDSNTLCIYMTFL